MVYIMENIKFFNVITALPKKEFVVVKYKMMVVWRNFNFIQIMEIAAPDNVQVLDSR